VKYGPITADPPSEGDPPAGNIRKALATDHAARESIAEADVIVGIDVRDPEHQALLFGRVVLERIARSDEDQDLDILEIPVEFETDDPVALVAECVALKGSSCYGDESLVNPMFN
jgi:hypothetical protein